MDLRALPIFPRGPIKPTPTNVWSLSMAAVVAMIIAFSPKRNVKLNVKNKQFENELCE